MATLVEKRFISKAPETDRIRTTQRKALPSQRPFATMTAKETHPTSKSFSVTIKTSDW